MKKSSLAPKNLLSLLVLWVMTAAASADKFKVATVDMGYLIREFHRFKAGQKFQEEEVLKIREAEQERLLAIKALNEEIQTMVQEMNDPSLSPLKRASIQEKAKEKQADLQVLQRELQIFLRDRDRELQENLATLQNEIVNVVMEAVNTYAETQDVDFVFDESGISKTDVPFLIYVRNRIDLTDPVLKILNKDAPEDDEAPPTETPGDE